LFTLLPRTFEVFTVRRWLKSRTTICLSGFRRGPYWRSLQRSARPSGYFSARGGVWFAN